MSGRIEIKHLSGTQETIEDQTQIVRYMKLETFLLLLAGQVFIPSYELLTSLDPLETELLFTLPELWGIGTSHANHIQRHVRPVLAQLPSRRDDLSRYFRSPTTLTWISIGDKIQDLKDHFRIWLGELSKERCIWCWNRFKSESHALWQLYGDRGVAVLSTVGAVKGALLHADVRRGIVAPVHYVDSQALGEIFSQPETFFLPHLLKSVRFDYEKEIRFILGANYSVLKTKKGLLANLDPLSIVTDETHVLVSPQLHPQERTVVRDIIKKAIHERKIAPEPSPVSESEILNRTEEPLPFPEQDGIPGAFRDLD